MDSPLNSSNAPAPSPSPQPIPMASPTVSSSSAAPTATPTPPATQSSIPKSVEREAPVSAPPQPDLAARPASPAPPPTPTPAPEVKKALAPTSDVHPLIITSILTVKAPAIKSSSPHAASQQDIFADATPGNNTTYKLPSGTSQSSHHGDTLPPVLSQPVMYIIIAGMALAVFLAGLTVWSCVQKRRRHRSSDVSSMSQPSEKEWGARAGGMERSEAVHDDLDFGPMMPAYQLPAQRELHQYKMQTILSLTDVYGSAKEWDGSDFDNMLDSPNQFVSMAERSPSFLRNSPSSLPTALLPGITAGRQPTVPGFRPYGSLAGRPMFPSVSPGQIMPAQAANGPQNFVERSFDHSSSSSPPGPDDTPIHANPEHFPVLKGTFPAARKLSSSFLPGADKSPPTDITPLPLPRYNFKQTSA